MTADSKAVQEGSLSASKMGDERGDVYRQMKMKGDFPLWLDNRSV